MQRKIETMYTSDERRIKMPRGDGTGPTGIGPKTGRAAGFCVGFKTPGRFNLGLGGAYRLWNSNTCGQGLGHRHWFFATGLPRWTRGSISTADTARGDTETTTSTYDAVSFKANAMLEALDSLEKRLSDLEAKFLDK
jgi:hypothetical protein